MKKNNIRQRVPNALLKQIIPLKLSLFFALFSNYDKKNESLYVGFMSFVLVLWHSHAYYIPIVVNE